MQQHVTKSESKQSRIQISSTEFSSEIALKWTCVAPVHFRFSTT